MVAPVLTSQPVCRSFHVMVASLLIPHIAESAVCEQGCQLRRYPSALQMLWDEGALRITAWVTVTDQEGLGLSLGKTGTNQGDFITPWTVHESSFLIPKHLHCKTPVTQDGLVNPLKPCRIEEGWDKRPDCGVSYLSHTQINTKSFGFFLPAIQVCMFKILWFAFILQCGWSRTRDWSWSHLIIQREPLVPELEFQTLGAAVNCIFLCLLLRENFSVWSSGTEMGIWSQQDIDRLVGFVWNHKWLTCKIWWAAWT